MDANKLLKSINHTITILKGDPITGKLTLSDRGVTTVLPSDTVTWVIGVNSGVKSITGISDDPNSTNVFSSPPKREDGNTDWKGTISSSAKAGTTEYYTICWEATTGEKPPCYDPRIQVN